MLAYLFRTFVWPAKRRMYDGKPVEIPAEGPDEEWIPPPREVRHDLGAIAM
jgi:hypothetical protein